MSERNEIRGLNACFVSGALTATGAVSTYDTTVAIVHCINGKLLSKATVAVGTTPTTEPVNSVAFTTLTANKGCTMVWCLNASGTVGVFQGPLATLIAGTFSDPEAPQFPAIPDAWVPFAYQVLKAGATAGTITFGTSLWNATGFTNAIVNVATLPDRPQTA